jgi:hypothetical protein
METKMNILQKIQTVSMQIMNLTKDMQVGDSKYGYSAVSDNHVTLAVKKAEKEAGILSIPIFQELVKTEIVKSEDKQGRDKINYVDVIKMTVRFYNVDNMEEFIDVQSYGRGLDTGDKGFGKASTYARKYALLNAYKIATGEDPDQEPNIPETPILTIDDNKRITIDYMMSNNEYLQSVLKYYSKGSIDDLSNDELAVVHKQLVAKKLI